MQLSFPPQRASPQGENRLARLRQFEMGGCWIGISSSSNRSPGLKLTNVDVESDEEDARRKGSGRLREKLQERSVRALGTAGEASVSKAGNGQSEGNKGGRGFYHTT